MAQSTFETTQYTAEDFIESSGTVLFSSSRRRICLLNHRSSGRWILAKGRRNIGESRQAAALRETKEETGFECHLLPVTMTTRAPPASEAASYPDEPKTHGSISEPFMVTHRILEGRLKIIWWYMAAIDEDSEQGEAELQFRPQFFTFDEALQALTFATDREIVREATGIFNATFKVET